MSTLKESTEEILDNAMEFNTEVQADHLSMQNTCAELLRLCKEQNDMACVYRNINPNTCDSCAEIYLELPGMEGYALTQDVEARMSQLRDVLANKHASVQRQIAQEVYAMLNGAIADLDKTEVYPRFHDIFTDEKETLCMDYHAWENTATTLKELLVSIAKVGSEAVSYMDLKNKFLQNSELNCLLTDLVITDDDYITMNVKGPSVQKFTTSDEEFNAIGPMLNNIADAQILKDLADMKHRLMERVNSVDSYDGIKMAHFAAQVIMAVKNSVLLTRQYFKACVNELD